MSKAVLLLAMGGPKDLKSVRLFLYRLFSDPCILRLPAPARQIVARLLAAARARAARKIYEKAGGFSPLPNNTIAQAAALESALKRYGMYQCFVGMTYSAPEIADAVGEIKVFSPDEIILLPLYPQYSTTTTEAALREARRQIEKQNVKAKTRVIENFAQEKGFIEAMAEHIEPFFEKAANYGAPRLLFSAHGLPERIARSGDPYPEQCRQTAEAIAQKLNLPVLDWGLCYQSRVGPMRWLKPSTQAEIVRAARARRPIVVAPISFVCEHVETLVELVLDGKELAEREGCPFYAVARTVSTHPAFIKSLTDLVTNS